MPKTILIIDDDPLLLELFSLLLNGEGYDVLKAGDGAEAVALMDRAPDLVVSDLVMPVMDGRAVMEEIEESCRALGRKPPPFVVMSAAPDLLRDFRARGVATLDKPVDPGRFVEVVRQALTD